MSVLSAADAAENEPDRTDPNKPLSEADQMRFRALVKDGARAAKQGRLSFATNAYSEALLLRMDPLIAGRLGLLLVHYPDARSHVDAAIGLYNAITQHAGESRAERKAFLDAYEIARGKVCALHVTTNDTNSVVQIDDGPPAKSFGRFWQYVAPGKHELLGTLKGHDDVRQTIDCPKGKRFDVSLDFTAKDAESESAEQVPEKRVFMEAPLRPSKAATSAAPEVPPEAPPEAPQKRPLYLSVGPTMVLGVAPSPSFGISLSAVYDVLSVPILVGVRGAYAVDPLTHVPMDIFSFTGLAGPCKRGSWWNVCGFASLNVIKPRLSSAMASDAYTTAYTTAHIMPGFGLGIGVRHVFPKGFSVYASGDATLLTEHSKVFLTRENRTSVLWEGNSLLASLSLGMEFVQ